MVSGAVKLFGGNNESCVRLRKISVLFSVEVCLRVGLCNVSVVVEPLHRKNRGVIGVGQRNFHGNRNLCY